eukprot:TRINITY_DN4073_c0_g3_i1.p2 TRINITY_DN4073_c0_g3~~TRINITY_DN4073_c0_g3_i1.p2  ORF type:complete len:202 (+),score=-22.26 TRINITY_DN4073_c0_g3_i1:1279-1884(+)
MYQHHKLFFKKIPYQCLRQINEHTKDQRAGRQSNINNITNTLINTINKYTQKLSLICINRFLIVLVYQTMAQSTKIHLTVLIQSTNLSIKNVRMYVSEYIPLKKKRKIFQSISFLLPQPQFQDFQNYKQWLGSKHKHYDLSTPIQKIHNLKNCLTKTLCANYYKQTNKLTLSLQKEKITSNNYVLACLVNYHTLLNVQSTY